MLVIDGSFGEGGGQILRTSISLSAALGIPIRIMNIRANRPQPGLKPQHFSVVSLMKQVTDADTTGLFVGSTSLEFIPHTLSSGNYFFDIGTAGSMVLLFQSLILSTLTAKKQCKFIVQGGTDVKWAPSWDYFVSVFLSVLQRLGIEVSVQLLRRGYYPKGGGEAEITIHPSNKKLTSLALTDPLPIHQVYGCVHLSGLPDHIAKRMKHAAVKTLLKYNIHALIRTDRSEADSVGTGLTLWSNTSDRYIGMVGLGEKGVSAETIGTKTAQQLFSDISSSATVDPFLCDQLLPFLCFCPGQSVLQVRYVSSHAETNMKVLNQFFNKKMFTIRSSSEQMKIIECVGCK